MAQMIPVECDLTRRPMSEQTVFNIIKENLSDEWTVFHSFDYLTRDLNYKLWDGEIVFLLYHPLKGFLVIEVKGGKISYRNGQWYQEDRKIDPFVQAKRNKYAVRNLLENKLLRTSIPMKFAHAVCFPSCSSQTIWPAEAQDIVITRDDLGCIEQFANHLLANTPLPAHIQGIVSDAEIRHVLSPMFEYGSKLSERMDIEKNSFSFLPSSNVLSLTHWNISRNCKSADVPVQEKLLWQSKKQNGWQCRAKMFYCCATIKCWQNI